MAYEISPEKMKVLKETYTDCLCSECLAEYATSIKPIRCGYDAEPPEG
jgi:hypothetical protein